jgi:hypothetical protein
MAIGGLTNSARHDRAKEFILVSTIHRLSRHDHSHPRGSGAQSMIRDPARYLPCLADCLTADRSLFERRMACIFNSLEQDR